MFQLLDEKKHRVDLLTQCKDANVETVLATGDKTFNFAYPYQNAEHIKLEMYVRTQTDEYIIKERDDGDAYTNFRCVLNVEELFGKDWDKFTNAQPETVEHTILLALSGTGWSLHMESTITKKRLVTKTYCSAWDVLQEIKKIFRIDYKFDTLTKTLHVYESIGSHKGAYFIEGLNIKKITIQSHTNNFATKLIAYGKDDLKVEVTNNTYSNKVIIKNWKDERYLDATSLREDAQAKLDEMAKPFKSYNVDIIDLASQSDKYSILEYAIGDTITLIYKDLNVKEVQRIVKMIQYPDAPEKNQIEIANASLTFEEIQKDAENAKQTVSNLTDGGGQISESQIKSVMSTLVAKIIDVDELNAISARFGALEASVAHIQDLSAVNAIIEDLKTIKAEITDLETVNASITNLKTQTAQITTLLAKFTSADSEHAVHLTSSNVVIDDGVIKNAMIESLGAGKITSGFINTNNVQIKSANGQMLIDGTTIKISDVNRPRVQIGEDAQHDYNIYIWDRDGHLMFDGVNGLHADAIKTGLIRNDMVADNANISGSKLNIASLFDVMNNDGTHTLKSSIIHLDDQNQTLDVAFKGITDKVDNIKIGGRNLYIQHLSTKGYVYGSDGGILPPDHGNRVSDFIEIDLKETYLYKTWIIEKDNETLWNGFGYYDVNKKFISRQVTNTQESKLIIPPNTKYVRVGSRFLESINNKCKLEKGTIFTDWTPAPEDVENSITTIQTSFHIEQGRIDQLIKDTTIAHTNGTTTKLIDAYNQTVNTVDGIKTEVARHETDLTDVKTKMENETPSHADITINNSITNTKDHFGSLIGIQGNTLHSLIPVYTENDIIINDNLQLAHIHKEVLFIKPNTTYTVIFYDLPNDVKLCWLHNIRVPINNNMAKLTFGNTIEQLAYIHFYPEDGKTFTTSKEILKKIKVVLLEGDHTTRAIPKGYFEGIKHFSSTEFKTVGKNLIDNNKVDVTSDKTSLIIFDSSKMSNNFIEGQEITLSFVSKSPFSGNTLYADYGTHHDILGYINGTIDNKTTITFKVHNIKDLKIINIYRSNGDIVKPNNIQIEVGKIATTFESYKENKQEITPELELGAWDSIDYEGNKIIGTGKYIFKGTESYGIAGEISGDTLGVYLGIPNLKKGTNMLLCDKLMPLEFKHYVSTEGIMKNLANVVIISLKKDKLKTPDVEGVKEYIKNNNITIYFETETPTKTNINPIALKTFNPITNYINNSIIPPKSLNVIYATTGQQQTYFDNINNITLVNGMRGVESDFKDAQILLHDIVADDKLTPNEKQELNRTLAFITAEHSKIVSEATKHGLIHKPYDDAFGALSTYLTTIIAPPNTTTTIEPNTFKSNFESYYNAKTDVLNAITSKLKTNTDGLTTKVTSFEQEITPSGILQRVNDGIDLDGSIHTEIYTFNKNGGTYRHTGSNTYTTLNSEGMGVYKKGTATDGSHDTLIASYRETANVPEQHSHIIYTDDLQCPFVGRMITTSNKKTIYVSASGGGDGTQSNPCSNINEALRIALDGANHYNGDIEIIVKDGTYDNNIHSVRIYDLHGQGALDVSLESNVNYKRGFIIDTCTKYIHIKSTANVGTNSHGALIKPIVNEPCIRIRHSMATEISGLMFQNNSFTDEYSIGVMTENSKFTVHDCDFYDLRTSIYSVAMSFGWIWNTRGSNMELRAVSVQRSDLLFSGTVMNANSEKYEHDYGTAQFKDVTGKDSLSWTRPPVTEQTFHGSFAPTKTYSKRNYTEPNIFYQASWTSDAQFGKWTGVAEFGNQIKNFCSGGRNTTMSVSFAALGGTYGYSTPRNVYMVDENGHQQNLGQINRGESKTFNITDGNLINYLASGGDFKIHSDSVNDYLKVEPGSIRINVSTTKSV